MKNGIRDIAFPSISTGIYAYPLEEAAKIDGCGPVKVFFKVVMPLLQPTMVTVFVMDIFWIWRMTDESGQLLSEQRILLQKSL